MINKTSNKYCFLDFEFNKSHERKMNLVSCSLLLDHEGRQKTKSYWLYNNQPELKQLKKDILKLRENGFIFVAFNVVAEASSLYSLNIDPRKCLWIDLQTEWKMLTNHWDLYAYGPQLIRGKVKETKPFPPYWEKYLDDDYEDSDDHSKCEKSLSAMTFKLLGEKIDTVYKDDIRNKIIADLNLESIKDEIMSYNAEDVKFLPHLLNKVLNIYSGRTIVIEFKDLLYRGSVSADTAMIERFGYPVDANQVRNFSNNVPNILNELCEDINSQFTLKVFEKKKKPLPGEAHFTMKVKLIREWVKNTQDTTYWPRTEKGEISLALDAFTKVFNYSHDYPRDNFGAQIVRYLKTRQSLNGFMPKRKGETFFDSLGSDSRVRSYLNPFGSQSGRFQPKATSFIPLKAAWMRALIIPPRGKMICGVDYSSEEFLIGAIWSKDKNMFNAYLTGDPYLAFAKQSGSVPQDATKETHKRERLVFKSTVLGIGYLMGAESLARKLTDDTGLEFTQEDAQELIDKYNETFADYSEALEDIQNDYQQGAVGILPDDWIMFGDNPNRRSVANFPVQGRGSTILRYAIKKSLDRGLKVIIPLHDALYVEFDSGDYKAVDTLIDCMREAFIDCFTDPEQRDWAKQIRLEAEVWGPDCGNLTHITTPQGLTVPSQAIHVDPRSISEYEKFRKYF